MRLIIHMGCHKTGTTSFQRTCAALVDVLEAAGVVYDTRGIQSGPSHQHSGLVWEAALGDFSSFRSMIQAAQEKKGAHTLLISGEAFENCLVQVDLGRRFEEEARDCGIEQVQWIVVHRDPFDYFQSLYAQVSNSPTILSYAGAAGLVLKTGHLTVANHNFSPILVFDIQKFLDSFSDAVSGSVEAIPYESFREPSAGRILLDRFLDKDELETALDALNLRSVRLNVRRTRYRVENDYTAMFFGFPWGGRRTRMDRVLLKLLLPIVALRLIGQRRAAKQYAPRMRAAFPRPLAPIVRNNNEVN